MPANVSSVKLYQLLAQIIGARVRCLEATEDSPYKVATYLHTARLTRIAANLLPSGAGIDGGTRIDLSRSTEERLSLDTAFHHMDEHGCYAGWSYHTVTVTASLASGLKIKISGRDREGIKDHLHEVFEQALTADVSYDVGAE